ncbi:MAG: class I SAM-dependent methyltransferase [Verrucomicrobiales bacterium]|jgi:hypothetical protein|nr:class I SAM-dependent methyltransferase [Verrucomicrobiales bacterium]
MIKKFLQLIFGLNGACIIRGFRFGLQDMLIKSRAAFNAVYPMEDKNHTKIPVVSLDEILGTKKVSVKCEIQRYENGMLPSDQAMVLISILRAENPQEVLEIGTFMGHTTKAMAENLPDSVIHTVDLPVDFSIVNAPESLLPKDDFHLIQQRVVGREFRGSKFEKQIMQHFGDTAQINFSTLGKPTFFFIDGSHTYEYCKSDSEKCLNLCQGHGVFLWHDCDPHHPGVTRFINEWRAIGRDIRRIKDTPIAYWKI